MTRVTTLMITRATTLVTNIEGSATEVATLTMGASISMTRGNVLQSMLEIQ